MNSTRRIVVTAIAAPLGLLAVIGAGLLAGQAINLVPQPHPTTVIEVAAQPGYAETPVTKTPAPAPVVEVVAPPADPATDPIATGPALCPDGTTAQAVDDAGNESNCIENGPDDTQCVAYDDNNNCTQYYKP